MYDYDANDQKRAEQRYARRQPLLLRLPAHLGDHAVDISARNISQTGFLAATDAPVRDGDLLTLELPEIGVREARIMWKCGQHIGCNFLQPIPRSAVSGALLRSEIMPGRAAGHRPGPAGRADLRLGEQSPDNGKLPMRTRLWIMAGCAILPWSAVLFAVGLL